MQTKRAPSDNAATSPARGDATQLAALARRRGWGRYGAFVVEYEKAARTLDHRLATSAPSRAQWNRWIAGELRGLPYVHHCRVLEAMFPGWTAAQLLAHPVDPGLEGSVLQLRSLEVTVSPSEMPAADTHGGLTAVFTSRTDFMASVSPIQLFDHARQIRAAGLSLNMLCQQFADQRLSRLVAAGTSIQALFLEPDGAAIAAREVEEGITPGHLSTLTRLNIDQLVRIRDNAPDGLADNMVIAVYDEPIRFNLTFVDDELCIAQPYLPAVRGVDSPTLLIHRRPDVAGLYETFERVYQWLEERSTPL